MIANDNNNYNTISVHVMHMYSQSVVQFSLPGSGFLKCWVGVLVGSRIIGKNGKSVRAIFPHFSPFSLHFHPPISKIFDKFGLPKGHLTFLSLVLHHSLLSFQL